MKVKVGDKVNEGDDLVEASTDKATFNVPSTANGKVTEILIQEGEEVKVGDILVRIETDS